MSTKRTYDYTSYFLRMLNAAAKLHSRKAAVLGMHWERWAEKQTFGSRAEY